MEEGRVFQVNISDGGVPKTAIRSVEITVAGLTGDRQRDLVHHGGPDRAVCLYSLDHIQGLQAEGHPIYPGSIGENITISGIDWEKMVPDVRLQIGDQVEIELTSYAGPCSNIAESFELRAYHRVSHKIYPGWSRVYARVLRGGLVQVGQSVNLI